MCITTTTDITTTTTTTTIMVYKIHPQTWHSPVHLASDDAKVQTVAAKAPRAKVQTVRDKGAKAPRDENMRSQGSTRRPPGEGKGRKGTSSRIAILEGQIFLMEGSEHRSIECSLLRHSILPPPSGS